MEKPKRSARGTASTEVNTRCTLQKNIAPASTPTTAPRSIADKEEEEDDDDDEDDDESDDVYDADEEDEDDA